MLIKHEKTHKQIFFKCRKIGAQSSNNQYVALRQMLSNVRASFKHSFNPIQA
jgi:hypothetical protein